MSHSITVKPSGRSYEAEPTETLLQAGLRAGLNLSHGCASGSCGECRARLLAGEITPAHHSDFRFSEAEREQGWFLMCCCRAVTDVTVEAPEPGSAAEIPEQTLIAKVSKVEQLQDAVVQLTVRTPRSQGLRFLAGQSVALAFDGLAAKTLPIASCPCDSTLLRFHLRRRDDDPFSAFVFDHLRRGEPVRLQGPSGAFTLDETSTRPLVLVAWESGFAPVASVIDHAIQIDEGRSIDLYWLSAIPRGHYLSNQCRAWRDVLDDFRYHSIDLQPAGGDRMHAVIERVVRVHSLLADHDWYLALPDAALAVANRLLAGAGVPRTQIHTMTLPHA